MDNEQLLKRGICPKCYRPLYESKYTDKILCDCEITTQPMDNTDKLKEIRESHFKPEYITSKYYLDKLEQIQSETLEYGKQLGREEVIKEIDQWSKRRFENYLTDKNRKAEHLNLWDKLNQLKEQK